jgi:hypothetical protein
MTLPTDSVGWYCERIAALEADLAAARALLRECGKELRQWAPNSVHLIARIDAAMKDE